MTSGGPLDNQTWQTEWITVLLAKVEFCISAKTQLWTLLFVMVSRLQNFPLLATVHDCETETLYSAGRVVRSNMISASEFQNDRSHHSISCQNVYC